MTDTAQSPELQEMVALETLYQENPGAYRKKVFGLIAIGYGYIFFVLLLILAIVVGGSYLLFTGGRVGLLAAKLVKIGIPLIGLAYIMVRSLFVKISPPDGIYLSPEKKKKVLDFFEPIRKKVGGPEIHHVVLIPDLNAAVQQIPSYGFFGPTTNYLIIGLPMLEMFDADELKSVIAHEFGHLSKAHGKMGAWIYRIDRTLAGIAESIYEKGGGTGNEWKYKFFNWFFPRFDKLTFPMRRGQEYEADEASALATSKEISGRALCKVHALGLYYKKFWAKIWDKARTEPEIKMIQPWGQLSSAVVQYYDPKDNKLCVEAGLRDITDYTDTHPCLSERLEALGVEPQFDFQTDKPASNTIFNESELKDICQAFDKRWHRESEADWQAHYEDHEANRKEYKKLAAEKDSLNAKEFLALAALQFDIHGKEKAIPLLEELIAKFPDYPDAYFRYGSLLIKDDLEKAEKNIAKSMELDVTLVPEAIREIRYGYGVNEKELDMDKYEPLIQKFREVQDQAGKERETLSTEDEMLLHDIPEEGVLYLQEYFSQFSEIAEVTVARKKTDQFNHHSVYLVAFKLYTFDDKVELFEDKWLARVGAKVNREIEGFQDAFTTIYENGDPWDKKFKEIGAEPIHKNVRKGFKAILYKFQIAFSYFALLAIIAAVGFLIYSFFAG